MYGELAGAGMSIVAVTVRGGRHCFNHKKGEFAIHVSAKKGEKRRRTGLIVYTSPALNKSFPYLVMHRRGEVVLYRYSGPQKS